MAQYFGAVVAPGLLLAPSYNVAPTNDVYAVVARGNELVLDAFHWGLVPMWAKDTKIGSKMINCRSETIAEKPSFKSAFAKRRCIIPVDGFFEWKVLPDGKSKQPMFIQRVDHEPLAFAGLWEVWKGADRNAPEALHSNTIITTTANEDMKAIHDRMPVLLPASKWNEWLDPTNHDIETLGKLLVPAPVGLLTMYPVSNAVGNVRNKTADNITPVEPNTLFG